MELSKNRGTGSFWTWFAASCAMLEDSAVSKRNPGLSDIAI